MARIEAYLLSDAEGSAVEYITDFSDEGIAAVAAAEECGSIVYALYDDGSRSQVLASEVSNPSEVMEGSATFGTARVESVSAQPTLRKSMSANALLLQSNESNVPWSGTLEIGGAVLTFEDGLLKTVGQG